MTRSHRFPVYRASETIRQMLGTALIFLNVLLTCRFTRVADLRGFVAVTSRTLLLGRYSSARSRSRSVFYPTLATDCVVKCSGFWYRCRAYSDDFYHAQGRYERFTKKEVLNALNEGDVFIDVGANIGAFVLQAARKVGTGGLVVAIEPIPENVALLEQNIKLNGYGNVRVIPWAAYSRKDTVSMYYQRSHSGGASLRPLDESIQLTVHANPLDVLMEGAALAGRTVGVTKIDVEGVEEEVVKGAPRTLERTRKVIIEIHDRPDIHSHRLPDRLRTLGFVPATIQTKTGRYMICQRVKRLSF